MARRKVKLAFIVNDSQRKATFKKRRKGLMKKASELSTLCGIDACAILYSEYEKQPDVWPDHEGVHRVLSQFKRMPEMEQNKKMQNNESFIRQRIDKANEQLMKQVKDNREKDVTMLMHQCLAGRGLQNLMMADLNDLGWVINKNLEDINRQIEALKISSTQEGRSREPAPENVVLQEQTQGWNVNADEDVQRPQWFTEWMNAQHEQMGFGRGNNMTTPLNEQMGIGRGNNMTTPLNEQMGFGRGNNMTTPLNDANNHGNIWPGTFFP